MVFAPLAKEIMAIGRPQYIRLPVIYNAKAIVLLRSKSKLIYPKAAFRAFYNKKPAIAYAKERNIKLHF